MNHTPLPWKATDGGGPDHHLVVGPNGHTIARIVTLSRRRADADFIVQAVNSHKALVEALKNLLPMGDNDGPLVAAYANEFESARRALALASQR